MAAHRYWRAVALEAYGAADLELSAFHLLAAGVRVDAAATLSASAAPDVSGVLANLQDDILATAARWSGQAIKSLSLTWDFGGAPSDVADIRLAGGSEARFPLLCKMQWSDDAALWINYLVFSGIRYPGSTGKTSSVSREAIFPPIFLKNWATDGLENQTLYGTSGQKHERLNGRLRLTSNGGADVKSRFDDSPYIADFEAVFVISVFNFGDTGLVYRTTNWLNANDTFGYVCAVRVNEVLIAKGSNASSPSFAVVGSASISITPAAPTTFRLRVVGSSHKLWVDDVLVLNVTDSTHAAGQIGARRYADVDSFSDFFSITIRPPSLSGSFCEVTPIAGRSAPSDILAIGSGPAIVYGVPVLSAPERLTIESGAVKDIVTGVLGQGIGRIRDTVKLKGTPNAPVKRRVRLIRERDGLQVREVWSDPVTGIYDFTYVDELQTWTVVSYDDEHDFRAVIADNLTLANGGVEIMA